MWGIFDVDLENGLVEESEGTRVRKKGWREGEKQGREGWVDVQWEGKKLGRKALSAHASLSAAEHKADSKHEENIGGVNFKPQI